MSKKMLNQFNCSKIMLPEHRSALKKHQSEASTLKPSHHINEDMAQEYQSLVMNSLATGSTLRVKILVRGKSETLLGSVVSIDSFNSTVIFKTAISLRKLKTQEIIGVKSGK